MTFELTKVKGTFLIKIINTENKLSTKPKHIHTVQGIMELRNGIYSTNDKMKFYLQGIYYWEIGRVLLIGLSPEEMDAYNDFKTLFETNTTVIRSIENDPSDFAKLEELVPSKDHCVVLLDLQLTDYSQNKTDIKDYKLDVINESKIVKEEEHTTDQPIQFFDKTHLSFYSGVMNSSSCEFYLKFSSFNVLDYDSIYSKSLDYVIVVVIIGFFQIYIIAKQLNATNTQALAVKVSLLSIGVQAILDSYICLFHLTTGLFMEPVFDAFATAAFIKVIIFSVFEMRFVLLVWKSRDPQLFAQGWQTIRRHLSLLYIRIYASLIFGFIFLYTFSDYFKYFVFLLYSFWIPQIYCNVTRDTTASLSLRYLFGISITRLYIPLYFFSCPYNFIKIEPDIKFSLILTTWVIFQAFILHYQKKLGPRFFIPQRFLPEKYNYFYKMDFGDEPKQCVICMSDIDPSCRYMITPCKHVFHDECLQQWMEFKMDCPTCRTVLTPV
eukprot:TRINITY_DN8625_c0_g1_i1.p1 TRINITY_DN8625_c0_g1~~TRINITY_DN8625_c0_g1_i1.p1  ORF type:complete len:579 (+),score=71.93 TRINITY_DN8625_c0_g1_i1:256-1737(+)